MIELRPGDKLAHMKIERLLGSGGMGSVYAAYDDQLDRQVAIKILSAVNEEEERARFSIEAKALSAVRHKGICSIYKLSSLPDGTPYLVLEYVEGQTLRLHLLRSKIMEWKQAAQLIVKLCEALECVHALGIIHRDIKPENIVLTSDGPKLLDFGLCRLPNQDLTQPGRIVGTVLYISPEQYRGEPATARSDIYALGCILFEMLTGKPIFASDNTLTIMQSHAFGAAPRLSDCGDVSPELESIINHSLAKDPADRPQSASQLAEELQVLLRTNNKGFTPQERTEPGAHSRPRKSFSIAGIVAAVGIAITAVLLVNPLIMTILGCDSNPLVINSALADARTMAALHNYGAAHSVATAILDAERRHNGTPDGFFERLSVRKKLVDLNRDIKLNIPSQLDAQVLGDTLTDTSLVIKSDSIARNSWKADDYENYEFILVNAISGTRPDLIRQILIMRDVSRSAYSHAKGDSDNLPGVHEAHLRALDQIKQKLGPTDTATRQDLVGKRFDIIRYTGDIDRLIRCFDECQKSGISPEQEHDMYYQQIGELRRHGRKQEALALARRARTLYPNRPKCRFGRAVASVACAELTDSASERAACMKEALDTLHSITYLPDIAILTAEIQAVQKTAAASTITQSGRNPAARPRQ